MTGQGQTTGAVNTGIPAEFPILAVINIAPVHGYDVWRYLKRNLGTVWQMGRSQVYGLLAQLERAGMVRHERVEQSNLPARKVFYLTEEGQAAVDRWIREPVDHVRELRVEFPTKLHFARTCSNALAQELLERQVAVCKRKRTEIETTRSLSTSVIEQHVLDYRIRVVEATVLWLQDMLDSEGADKETVTRENNY